jgi:hypothetical protein
MEILAKCPKIGRTSFEEKFQRRLCRAIKACYEAVHSHPTRASRRTMREPSFVGNEVVNETHSD